MIIGESLTEFSFMGDDGAFVLGAPIDLTSMEGQSFLDLEIILDNPSLRQYMPNATGGRPLDFKNLGRDQRGNLSIEQYRYRASLLRNGSIASARDVGNVAAGLVARRAGLSWRAARMGFDGLQTWQDLGWNTLRVGPSVEGRTSRAAQAFGHWLGVTLRAIDER